MQKHFPFVVHKCHSKLWISSFFYRYSTIYHVFLRIPQQIFIILHMYEHSATISFFSTVLFVSVNFVEKLWDDTRVRRRWPSFLRAFTLVPQRSCTDRQRASRSLWLRRKFFFHYRSATIAPVPFSTYSTNVVNFFNLESGKWRRVFWSLHKKVKQNFSMQHFPILFLT